MHRIEIACLSIDASHREQGLLHLLNMGHVLVEVHREVISVCVFHSDVFQKGDTEDIVAKKSR